MTAVILEVVFVICMGAWVCRSRSNSRAFLPKRKCLTYRRPSVPTHPLLTLWPSLLVPSFGTSLYAVPQHRFSHTDVSFFFFSFLSHSFFLLYHSFSCAPLLPFSHPSLSLSLSLYLYISISISISIAISISLSLSLYLSISISLSLQYLSISISISLSLYPLLHFSYLMCFTLCM